MSRTSARGACRRAAPVLRRIRQSTGPTLKEVQALLDRRGPDGITTSAPVWLASFRINERKASEYRAGRVFLAGDAAHIHSPAGGQASRMPATPPGSSRSCPKAFARRNATRELQRRTQCGRTQGADRCRAADLPRSAAQRRCTIDPQPRRLPGVRPGGGPSPRA
ncbi:MAG TPA: FAD-dependent monooxygenase [Acidobacteriaceae bacterium]